MSQPPQYWVLGVYFAAVLALTAAVIGVSYVLGERHAAPAELGGGASWSDTGAPTEPS